MIHNITVYAHTCMSVCVCVRACVRECVCDEFISRNLYSCVLAVVPYSMVVLRGCCLHFGGYLVIPGKYPKLCASVMSIIRVEK